MGLILDLVLFLSITALIFFMIAIFRYYNKSPKGTEVVDVVGELKKIANVKENIIDGRKIFEIENKKQVDKSATIIYLHGGAYIGGITRRHLNVIYKFLEDIQMKIVLPDYPLAPRATYVQVFEWLEKLYAEYQNEENVIFVGDSAGAGLALAFAQKLGIESKVQPKKLILISPWLDLTLENEIVLEKEKEEKILNRKVLKLAAEMYSGDDDCSNYMMSPVNGPFDKIENLVVFTGTADMLNPDSHLLKERIKENELMNFKFFEKENAVHNWIFEDLENSKEEYQQLVKEILGFEN